MNQLMDIEGQFAKNMGCLPQRVNAVNLAAVQPFSIGVPSLPSFGDRARKAVRGIKSQLHFA
jgi:hypothetical protein